MDSSPTDVVDLYATSLCVYLEHRQSSFLTYALVCVYLVLLSLNFIGWKLTIRVKIEYTINQVNNQIRFNFITYYILTCFSPTGHSADPPLSSPTFRTLLALEQDHPFHKRLLSVMAGPFLPRPSPTLYVLTLTARLPNYGVLLSIFTFDRLAAPTRSFAPSSGSDSGSCSCYSMVWKRRWNLRWRQWRSKCRFGLVINCDRRNLRWTRIVSLFLWGFLYNAYQTIY